MGIHRGGLLALAILGMAAALMLPAVPAGAFHDQGYPCYQCHSLKPSDIRAGSNAIRVDQPVLSPVPVSPSGTQAWSGGMPITCDFCHKATDDVPTQNFAVKAYKHPVRTIMDNATPPVEIACGDCHNGDVNANSVKDLTPPSMVSKTPPKQGYPDHDNVTSGYAHNLTSNPPHLTVPYWSASSLPGVTRANDTTFWAAVKGGSQDIVCWVCHESGRTNLPSSGPMTGRVSTKIVKGDYTGTGAAKGHQIQTLVTGAMGVGSALPCYDCHDSHGSVNRAFVLDNQSIYGAATAQVAVTTFNQGARPYNDKIVCAQCHDTGNTVTQSTKTHGAGFSGKIVEGLYPVDPFNSTSTAGIHQSVGVADNLLLSTRNCLAANQGCHASPHNPVGESVGGQNCAVCHSGIFATMDNNTSTGYHHVLLSDEAPPAGVYPTTPQPLNAASTRTCTICHVDHNYFSTVANPANLRARNLRRSIAVQPDNGSNAPLQTDFDNTVGGICTSCHQNTQTKNSPGTNIKDDNTTTTPVVSQSFFGGSAHNYPSSSPYIESHFTSDNSDANSRYRANCTKCHNDTSSKIFQDNTAPLNAFSLHASDGANAVDKLLAPLGYTPLTDNLNENFCYRCHSHSTDAIPGTRKSVDARDWYNNIAMDNAAESVYGEFQRTSRHPVASVDQVAGAKVVECVNCHNVHLTRSATGSVVANPDNTYAYEAYNLTDNSQAGKGNRAGFCLKCHDGAGPAYTVTSSSYVPSAVYATAATMNKSTNGSRGHWSVTGQLQATTIVACDGCHDKHGSTFPKLLGTFDPNGGQNKVFGNQQTVVLPTRTAGTATAQDNASVCSACHTNAGVNYPPTSVTLTSINTQETYRDGTGYFNPNPVAATTMRWPGFAVWDNLSTISSGNGTFPVSPHRNNSKTGPSALGSRGVADCNGCHDPHGTSYTYNMLADNMVAGRYNLCFDCHGASGPATDNIAGYYPGAAGGTGAAASAAVHTGHNIKTSGGMLSQFTGLPCYDCHVTHGSRNGNTQLKSDQRWSNLGNTKYGATSSDNAADNASRVFCLGCHVTTDGRDGYGNTVAAGDNVENLSRLGANKLRLPTTNAIVEHSSAWLGNGCQRCHYGRNYNDNTYGPHYPATGLCDTCHESQGTRSAAAATYNGAHQTHTDNTQYGFACKQCHSWTATVSKATHKNDNAATQHAEVRFDNQATSGWSAIQYATPFSYGYRSIYNNPYTAGAAVPTYAAAADNATVDGRQSSVRWTNGTCGTVWCHSNANPIGGLGAANAYQSPTWLDNALRTDCTGCHGGDLTSTYKIGDNATILNGSVAHLKHVNGGIGCYKCHNNTVKTTNNRQIDNVSGHVNGNKDVAFDPASVGGTWDNSNKTCSGTYCHGSGGGTLPRWDNLATVTGCGVCHQNQGAGASPSTTGAHHPHTNSGKLKIACETCHANKAASHTLAIHAGGPDNSATGRTAEVRYTDNGAVQSYDGIVFLSKNLWNSPFDNNNALSPSYAGGGSSAGNDGINPQIHWTAGTCQNVWCHSNAKPLSWKGTAGGNRFTTPSWTANCLDCHNPRPTDVNCKGCHSGVGTAASMAGADNLSNAHVTHAATDRYAFTCDECHAWTVMNDGNGTSGFSIIAGTGHDNHVDGIKTVKFGTTLRVTNIDQSGGAYDNSAYRCSNTYCHSSGMDNIATNGGGTGYAQAGGQPRDNTVSWNSATGGNCATCHGWTAASGTPIMTQAHDNHVNNAATLGQTFACNRCHNATVAADNTTILSYTLHVNGYKDVVFPVPTDNGSYVNGTKTCTTYCHRQGNKTLTGGADNLAPTWDCTVDTSCKTCHGSKAVSAGTYHVSYLGEPNYDNGAFGATSLNSHSKHVSATDTTTRCQVCHPTANPTTLNVLASDNWARHLNDNVDVAAGNGASFTWAQGTHTCSGISCHNGGTAQWGASLNCYDCHTGTGDIEDFGTGGNPATMINNGRTARIDSTEWTTRGHGLATGNYPGSNRPAAAFTGTGQCLYCHNSAITHDNTSNIFRLANYDYYGNGWNDVCMICHRKTGGHAGYNGGNATTALVDNNHYGAKHTTTYDGGKFCHDCHDPHGDNNIFMVAKRASMRTDNVFGIPLRSSIDDNTYRPPVAFTNNVSGADYADNTAPFNGICQVCHEAASGVKHYTTTGQIDAHFTTKCTTCHLHDAAFKGLGGPDVGQYFDRLAFANYPDNSSHPLRGLTTGDTTLRFAVQGSENCLGCHYGSGSGKTSDECLVCHFENVGSGGTPGALDGTRHMDQQLELATVSGNSLPTSQFTIATIQDYDTWCLQCHKPGSTTSLGGITPSVGAKTIINDNGFTAGRHRAQTPPVGCIYCHQPHGRANTKLVRENPDNRRNVAAGPTPARFGVYPNDNLSLGGYGTAQNLAYRSRPYWADNTLPYLPEADDDQAYCNKACHVAKFSTQYVKDKMIKRDGGTGNYVLAPGNKKIYLINGGEYTVDNIYTSFSNPHVHPNGDIITTDNMVRDYANLIGLSGPSYYQYPLSGGSANPSAYIPANSDLPFFPDYFGDSVRDFSNAWNNLGVRIAYRHTCSTCHNPHGTIEPNSGTASEGYPDLRLRKTNPNTLCLRCHK